MCGRDRVVKWAGRAGVAGLLIFGVGYGALVWIATVARDRIARQLEDQTGHRVELGRVIPWGLGTFWVQGAAVTAPRTDTPWFVADSIRFERPTLGFGSQVKLTLNHPTMRFHRRPDGCYDPTDALAQSHQRRAPSASPRAAVDGSSVVSFEVGRTPPNPLDDVYLEIRHGVVEWRDPDVQLDVRVEEVEGVAFWLGSSSTVVVQEAQGRLADGQARFAVQVHAPKRDQGWTIEGQLQLRRVNPTPSLIKLLGRVAPVVTVSGEVPAISGPAPQAHSVPKSLDPIESARLFGRLQGELYLETRGRDRRELLDSLRGQGRFRLDPIEWEAVGPLAQLADELGISSKKGRIASLLGCFEVERRAVRSDRLELTLGPLPLEMTGVTQFDGAIDFVVALPGSTRLGRLNPAASEWLKSIRLEPDALPAARIVGRYDQPRIECDPDALKTLGRRLETELIRKLEQRQRDRLARPESDASWDDTRIR